MTTITTNLPTPYPPAIVHPHGIWQLDADYVTPGVASVYVIRQGERLAIIETGTAYTVPHILDHIAALGLTPEQVDYVIPTHVHLDHAAGAGKLMAECPNARLVIHPRGAAHMIDPSKLEAGTRAVYGDERYDSLYGALIPIAAERVIEAADAFTLDFNGRTLTFLDTQGHAKHHFCVLDSGSNSIFTGDTFGVSYRMFDNDAGENLLFVTTTPIHFDPEAMRASILRLAGLKPEFMYLTHYGAIRPTEHNVQQLLDSLDTVVAIAEQQQTPVEGRLQRITDSLAAWLLERVQQVNPAFDITLAKQWLATDANLNAQGLEVWLTKKSQA
ncbi:MBL fold metallo-hydrolase [Candidatus Thalassolituus haligoni]|jgi:glyoxylase-like metal-dependent hydrolase (beta-lactamase superfamily II)|uniref:MBL fold metallo-hydrolase n=1 Tax=Candidatus Thalassolituus haligoni TaxID=3100113 RepID=UPI00351219C2|tara:strand:- start:40516 stop:41502 length:987 start_codon:yes stop_codon:yes gene_type:complete